MTEPLASALSIRVLDLTEDRGLYAGKLLADLGADVIKIEAPGGGKARRTGPFKDDVPGLENSLYFINFNTNKKGITLNLDNPQGREIFKKLVSRADVVIEDFEAGRMESLGLDYPALREINNRLIFASVTGFGQDGPYSSYKAPDIVSFAMGGLMHTSGSASEPPVVAPCEQSFHSASAVAVFGIMAAIFLRLSTNTGQQVHVSAEEVITTFSQAFMRYSVGTALGARSGSQFGGAPARIFPCKDGYVHFLVFYPNHWRAFVELLGSPEAITDRVWYDSNFRSNNRDIIDPLVTTFTMSRTKSEITELCQSKGIPCNPVNSCADISQDDHFIQRGFFKEMEHPVIGRYSCLNPPYRLSETPGRIVRPAPLLGQHNGEIYGQELGYGAEELDRLKSEGII
jgi:crotonobetainyl-CoA:carnitine CoA-transferase CaiB-like acyl-CoA transferase